MRNEMIVEDGSISWLHGLTLFFREEGDEEGSNSSEEDEADKADESEEEGNEDNSEEEVEDTPEARVKALEDALAAERRLRRKVERDAKRQARQKSADKNQTEDVELQKQLSASVERTTRLAQGLLNRDIDAAILSEARKQDFIDPTDALLDSIRKDVDYDQDEEEPTEIDIDLGSVADAVKALADKKKHLIAKRTIAGGKSGSKFRNNSSSSSTTGSLGDHYPSLR